MSIELELMEVLKDAIRLRNLRSRLEHNPKSFVEDIISFEEFSNFLNLTENGLDTMTIYQFFRTKIWNKMNQIVGNEK